MEFIKTALLGLVTSALVGCASAGHGDRSGPGYLAETAGSRVPTGLTPAFIFEIDGERVFYGRGTHWVEPGRHTIRVWPVSGGPRGATPIPAAHADAKGVKVESIVIDVEEGGRYYFAAAVRRHRVEASDAGSATALGPWRTTIVPVLVRAT